MKELGLTCGLEEWLEAAGDKTNHNIAPVL